MLINIAKNVNSVHTPLTEREICYIIDGCEEKINFQKVLDIYLKTIDKTSNNCYHLSENEITSYFRE